MTKLLFVCHGNICRSTMCQCVMQDMVNKMGLEDLFEIDSRATSREEIGNPPHHGTVRKMQEVGIPVIPHKATQITQQDYDEYDYIICMDENNLRNIKRIIPSDPKNKISRLMDFTQTPHDVADPWYTGDFEKTKRDIIEGCNALLNYILRE